MIPKCYNLPKASQNQPHNSLLFNYFRGFGACHVASTFPGSTSNCHQFGPTWITGMIHDQTNHLQRMFGTENWPKKISQFLELPSFFGGKLFNYRKPQHLHHNTNLKWHHHPPMIAKALVFFVDGGNSSLGIRWGTHIRRTLWHTMTQGLGEIPTREVLVTSEFHFWPPFWWGFSGSKSVMEMPKCRDGNHGFLQRIKPSSKWKSYSRKPEDFESKWRDKKYQA